MKIPGLAWSLIHNPQHDWMYRTVPQEFACLAAENSESAWPRGKVLGGSSTLNLMQYVRGHPLDYDSWASITGDESWKYDNLLPYFIKSLDYNGQFAANEKNYGKRGGLLHVEYQTWRPMEDYFFEAGRNLGFGILDFNGPQNRSGFGPVEFTTKNAVRQDTFTALLEPFLGRKNLRIFPYAQVTKIHLDKNKIAYGVSYMKHGKLRFARAKNEIILSSGAANSPQLLMLSGIGPKKHLQSMKIKPKVVLPVGENLQDHIAVMVGPFTINQTGLSYINERDFSVRKILDYVFNSHGPLVSSAGTGGQAFISTTEVLKSGVDWPNLQFYMLPLGTSDIFAQNIAGTYGFQVEELRRFYGHLYGQDAFNLLVTLVRPKSIGHIRLQNKNPLSAPLIDPKYLEHADDRKALLEGVKFAIRIAEETSSFQKLNAKLTSMPFPGCEHLPFRSDAYWECYIHRFSTNLYHPVGTCSMGRGGEQGQSGAKDSRAVLDSKLRVIGVKSLRVADASIMPIIVNGNTNAPCIMIGERAADFIREYWANQFLVCKVPDNYYFIEAQQNQCFYSKIV